MKPLNRDPKRQRTKSTGALHDANAWSRAPGQRVSVLDCASPLALSHGLTGARFMGRGGRSGFELHEGNGLPDTHCCGDVLRTGTVRGPIHGELSIIAAELFDRFKLFRVRRARAQHDAPMRRAEGCRDGPNLVARVCFHGGTMPRTADLWQTKMWAVETPPGPLARSVGR